MLSFHAFHAELLLLDYPLVTIAMTGFLESLPYRFVVPATYVQLRPILNVTIIVLQAV